MFLPATATEYYQYGFQVFHLFGVELHFVDLYLQTSLTKVTLTEFYLQPLQLYNILSQNFEKYNLTQLDQLFKVTISPEKIILRKEKKLCAIFIHAYFRFRFTLLPYR